mgnify:CR=1 FL=1
MKKTGRITRAIALWMVLCLVLSTVPMTAFAADLNYLTNVVCKATVTCTGEDGKDTPKTIEEYSENVIPYSCESQNVQDEIDKLEQKIKDYYPADKYEVKSGLTRTKYDPDILIQDNIQYTTLYIEYVMAVAEYKVEDYEIDDADKGKTWMKDSIKGLSFTTNADEGKLYDVKVDGKTINSSCYKAALNNNKKLVVTLEPGYLQGLNEKDGYPLELIIKGEKNTCETTFNVGKYKLDYEKDTKNKNIDSWKQSSNIPLRFISSYDFTDLDKITVDGKDLDKGNIYYNTTGKTLEFTQRYLDSLGKGLHEFIVTYKAGAACSLKFEIKPAPNYEIIKVGDKDGNKGSWKKGSEEGLTFKANRNFKFLDGIDVYDVQGDEQACFIGDYTVNHKDTTVTLEKDFLQSLKKGDYKLKLLYGENGADTSAEATFTILPRYSIEAIGDSEWRLKDSKDLFEFQLDCDNQIGEISEVTIIDLGNPNDENNTDTLDNKEEIQYLFDKDNKTFTLTKNYLNQKTANHKYTLKLVFIDGGDCSIDFAVVEAYRITNPITLWTKNGNDIVFETNRDFDNLKSITFDGISIYDKALNNKETEDCKISDSDGKGTVTLTQKFLNDQTESSHILRLIYKTPKGRQITCETSFKIGAEYKITEGQDSTWTASDKNGLHFASNVAYGKLRQIKVDGKRINLADYTKTYSQLSDDTNIALTVKYLKELLAQDEANNSLGQKHTLVLEYLDGGSCETTFVVKKKLADININFGADSKWTRNSSDEIVIGANGDNNDLKAIKIDNTVYDENNNNNNVWEKQEGGKIAIKSNHLQGLADGEHTLTLFYGDENGKDGSCVTKFTVVPDYKVNSEKNKVSMNGRNVSPFNANSILGALDVNKVLAEDAGDNSNDASVKVVRFTINDCKPEYIEKVTIGDSELALDKDYTVEYNDDQEIAIIQLTDTYLQSLNSGNYTIEFQLKWTDEPLTMNFTIGETKYEITAVDGSEWVMGSQYGLKFQVKGGFSKLTLVRIGDKVLAKDVDYTIDTDSNVITLKPSCLNGLDVGDNKLELFYGESGIYGDCSANFTVKEEPFNCEITEGNGSEWTQNSSRVLTFTVRGGFDKLTSVRIGDKELAKDVDYIIDTDSNAITLTTNCLNELDVGDHTLTLFYGENNCSATFTVEEEEEPFEREFVEYSRTWTKGSNEEPTYTVIGGFNRLTLVTIESKELAKDVDYTIDTDSNVITLKLSCLNELDVGLYTLKLFYGENGSYGMCFSTLNVQEAPFACEITAGNGSEWTQNSNEELKFTVNGGFDKLTLVRIGDKELAKDVDYTLDTESNVITLKPSCLNGLDVGDHTLTLFYGENNCSANFTVKEAKPDYKVIEGANGSWTKNSDGTLTFRANGDFDKFTGVKVDGKLIDSNNYKAVSGSTVITLTTEYLQTLSTGRHELTVVYTDGDCNTYFVINAAASEQPGQTENNNNNTPGQSENGNTNNGQSSQTENGNTAGQASSTEDGNTTSAAANSDADAMGQKTGDNNSFMVWVAFLFVSFGGIVLSAKSTRRKEDEE